MIDYKRKVTKYSLGLRAFRISKPPPRKPSRKASQKSAMKQAVCTFCGTDDPSVQVICDGRCLICASCQRLSSVTRLLRDSFFSSAAFDKERPIIDSFEVGSDSLLDVGTRGGGGGAGEKGGCPVCGERLSQSMVQTILIMHKQSVKESNNTIEDYTTRHVGEVDMGLQSNWFNVFIKRYKSVYEDGNKDYREEADITTIENNDDNDNSTLKTRPSTASGGEVKRNKLEVKKVDIYAVGPPKLNANSAIAFGIDCLCHQWLSLQNNHTESFVHVAMKRCCRKKSSQRTNDFKAKSVVDFFSVPSNVKSPILLLLTKLLAFHPKKADFVRPTWGIITVAVIILVNFEKCLRSGKLFLADGLPAVSDLKKRIEGKDRVGFNDKIMPLKRAIKVIEVLLVSNQMHWNMTPYTAGCVEYSARLPWADASISKLLHLLFYAIEAGDEVLEVERRDRGADKVNFPPVAGHSPEGSRPATTDRSSRPRNGDKLKSPPPSRGGHGRSDPAAEQSAARQIRRLESLSRKAHQLWRCKVHKVSDKDLAAAGSASAALGVLAPGRVRVPDCSVTNISLQSAYNASTGMTVQLSVLCLVVVEAWEREYQDLQASLRRASVTRERKPAFSGYLDGAEVVPFSKIEKLGLTKIVDHYAIYLQQTSDLDWDEVKALAGARKYPFTVPQELLLKSNAELDYHFNEINFDKRKRRLKENMEDMLAAGGPYSQAVLQAALLEGEGAFGLRETRRDHVAHKVFGRSGATQQDEEEDGLPFLPTPLQRDAISRGQYLASQTIGEGGDGSIEGAGRFSRPVTSLNPSSYPLGSAPALPLSAAPGAAPSVNTLQMAMSGALLQRDGGFDEGLGDSRPTLLDYMQGDADAPHQSFESAEEAHFIRDAANLLSVEREMSASASQKYRGLVERQKSAGYRHDVVTPSGGTHRPEIDMVLSPATRNGALAKLPYQSPSPGRHGLNIVDVIAMRASTAQCLSKIRLLDERPLTNLLKDKSLSSTGMAHGASLDDDLFGFMEKIPFGFSPMHSTLRPSTSTYSMSSKGTIDSLASSASLIGSVVDALNLDAIDNNFYAQSRTRRGASPLKTAKMRIKNRMSAPYEVAILQESAKESRALGATRYYDEEGGEAQTAKGITGLGPNPAGPAGEDGGIKTVLVLNSYVGAAFGNVESRRSQDILVDALVLENSDISPKDFELACHRYLGSSAEQLNMLRKIQISGNSRLNAGSADILGSYFQRRFNLVHLNISNNNFGDIGCSKLFTGIVASGGALQLRRLEMSGTNVVLAVSGMATLSKFTELRALDMSCNCITLDISMSKRTILNILDNLTNLETLSLAFNRIRDDGLKLISGALKNMRELKVLDLANTFITKLSLPLVEHFMREAAVEGQWGEVVTNQKLQALLLQGHLCTAESLVEIRYQLGVLRAVDVVFEGPYETDSLRYPLRYSVSQS